jgi:hypothetical protein
MMNVRAFQRCYSSHDEREDRWIERFTKGKIPAETRDVRWTPRKPWKIGAARVSGLRRLTRHHLFSFLAGPGTPVLSRESTLDRSRKSVRNCGARLLLSAQREGQVQSFAQGHSRRVRGERLKEVRIFHVTAVASVDR